MRCLLAVLFLLGAASVADARQLTDDEPLPAADAALPRDVLGEARDTAVARRSIDAIPRGRVMDAAPAAALRAAYEEGPRRSGVHWSVPAAVNFVEPAFGRVRSASEAGARGPMQFLPATAVGPPRFLTYYAWQVYVRTPSGSRRITGPGV